MVGQAGSPMCTAHNDVTLTWSNVKVKVPNPLKFQNCTFLRVPLLLFWHGAHSWWVITIVWDLVYSFSEPHFLISPTVGCHMTSKFAKCCYHQNPLCFMSTLAEATSLWLWLQVGRNKPCMLAAMTVSLLVGLFYLHYVLNLWGRVAVTVVILCLTLTNRLRQSDIGCNTYYELECGSTKVNVTFTASKDAACHDYVNNQND